MTQQRNDILLIATGCYSDYQNAAFRVTKPFVVREALAEFRLQWAPDPEMTWKKKPYPEDVIAWLSAQGYIEDLNIHELHVGPYGDIEINDEQLNLVFSPSQSLT